MSGTHNQLEDLHYEDRGMAGIHLAKPTGKVDPENNQYIEVELLRDVIMYARPCYPFGFVSAPSEEWLTEHKDSIFVWVMYQGENPSYPIWLGFTFVDGRESYVTENFPKMQVRFSKNFSSVMDDELGKYRLKHTLSDTAVEISENKVNIESLRVNLGSENAQEPAILGQTLVGILQELISAIEAITVTTSMGPSSVPVNIIQFSQIAAKLNTLKSKKIFIE